MEARWGVTVLHSLNVGSQRKDSQIWVLKDEQELVEREKSRRPRGNSTCEAGRREQPAGQGTMVTLVRSLRRRWLSVSLQRLPGARSRRASDTVRSLDLILQMVGGG